MWFHCLKTPLYGNEKCILPWIWTNPLVSSCTLNSFCSSHINLSSPQTANTYSPSFSLSRFLPFSLSRVSERQIQEMRFNFLLEEEARTSLHRVLRCWPEVYIYMCIYIGAPSTPIFPSPIHVQSVSPHHSPFATRRVLQTPFLPFSHFTFLLSRKFPLRPSSRNPRRKTIHMSSQVSLLRRLGSPSMRSRCNI